MVQIIPFHREVGKGPLVVCLHSGVSSSGQWRSLMQLLADRYRVIAPDFYGAGKTPPWPGSRELLLDDEVSLIEPLFDGVSDRFCLVGHSYGAAVGIKAALKHRQRVRGLVVYEPVLFNLLFADDPDRLEAQAITSLRSDILRSIDAGTPESGAERFVDYWAGRGTWAAIPADKRPLVLETMAATRSIWDSACNDPLPLSAYSTLDVPTLYLLGELSPPPSWRIAELLGSVLPKMRLVRLIGIGHMGLATHADKLNATISEFLDATPG